MTTLITTFLRKNFNLVLLLSATVCIALALGEVFRGGTWSLLLPVSMTAVVCSWILGASRLTAKQAWRWLTALGIPGVFLYTTGLVRPLWRLLLSALALVPAILVWITDRVTIDASALLLHWTDLTAHFGSVLTRLSVWTGALFFGNPVIDPLAAGLVWDLLLWLIGSWAGWHLRRHRHALKALAPGGVMLALVLDYTRGEVGFVILYLALLLTLTGSARNEWRHVQWKQRKIDYAESIHLETLMMVGMVTTLLVLLAAAAPSLSWREFVDRFRKADQAGETRVAESLGLEPRVDAANNTAFRSGGLPRSHLLELPPERLQDVVMRIRTGELPPTSESPGELQPNRYYWRSITYDVYTGGGWRSSPAQMSLLPAQKELLELPHDYRIVNQHIEHLTDQDTTVYWTGILARADVDVKIAWRVQPPPDPDPTHNGDMLGAITNLNEYTVVSYSPRFSASTLRSSGSAYPAEITEHYLGLPESIPERVLALARELTQASATPYDKATALQAYLRTFPYTLEVEPPPTGRDVVDYFLFTTQQGYCDYYATAMVVLARAVGLPARIVIGYSSGDYDAETAEYIIREEHAHSWVEIYFPGIGWVEFEPTASQPMIEMSGDDLTFAQPANPPGGRPAISWLRTGWRSLVSSLGGQFMIAGMAIVLSVALWQATETFYLHLLPTHKAVQCMYQKMEKLSARLLPGLPVGHTPHQLHTALTATLTKAEVRVLELVLSRADIEIESLVKTYMAQVFSAHPPARPQVSKGIRAWARLRWRLWIAIWWHRLHKA